jgi:hypothetical protein
MNVKARLSGGKIKIGVERGEKRIHTEVQRGWKCYMFWVVIHFSSCECDGMNICVQVLCTSFLMLFCQLPWSSTGNSMYKFNGDWLNFSTVLKHFTFPLLKYEGPDFSICLYFEFLFITFLVGMK